MTDDCYSWELERSVWRVDWAVRVRTDTPYSTERRTILVPTYSVVNHSVVVDTMTEEQAIDRAWGWCSKEQRPKHKEDMVATKMKMLL